jgi:Tol biopolymer transport system component
MLSGKKAFQAPTSAETMTAILNEDPPSISQLVPNLPPGLQRVVHRCVEKNPERRFQSASDLAFALEALSDSGTASIEKDAQGATHPLDRNWRRYVAAGVIAFLVALYAVFFWFRAPLTAPRVLSITQLTSDDTAKGYLVTDGPRLYLQERLNDRGVLAQVSSSGGEVSPIPTPFKNAWLHDVAPSRSELLIDSFDGEGGILKNGAGGPFWIIPVPAGSPRRVGDSSFTDAAWSADGQQLVYTQGHEIYLALWDGSQARRLTTCREIPTAPQFSPDGARLRFTSFTENGFSFSIWEMKIDGTGLRPVLPSNFHQDPGECCGRWTRDGRYYFFTALRNGQIWAIRETAGLLRRAIPEPVQITTGPLNYSWPTPALNDDRVFAIGRDQRAQLQRYDVKTRQFVPFLNGISAGQIDFSRDGQWATYITFPDNTLWRGRIDGTEKLRLTSPPMTAAMPRLSPDGKRVAFLANMPGQPWKIHVVSIDGGTPEQLLPNDAGSQDDPGWSPDGKTLLFAEYSKGPTSSNAEDYSLLYVDLQNKTSSKLPGSTGMFAPRWSPDGRYITTFSADGTTIMLFELSSEKWVELSTGKALEYPNWTRDSKYLQFEDTGKDGPTIDRVRIADHNKEVVVSLKNVPRVLLNNSSLPWNGVAPNDSILIMRDVGSRQAYSIELQLP